MRDLFTLWGSAQDAFPKFGSKPIVQLKFKGPNGLQTHRERSKGTKLWAGDCIWSELLSVTSTAEPKQSAWVEEETKCEFL